MAAMRKTTIRLSPRTFSYIEEAAAHQDVSFAQYVREAALARAVYEAAERGSGGMPIITRNARELERLAAELRAEADGS